MPGSWPQNDFPSLTNAVYTVTSPIDRRYNCIAWSIGDVTKWWWPDRWNVGFWPANAPREDTVAAFTQMYSLFGYQSCLDGFLEIGFEKIALYAVINQSGIQEPTHAAFQLENGHWTSKLGIFEDIDHFVTNALNGNRYGTVIQYMKRVRQSRPTPPNR